MANALYPRTKAKMLQGAINLLTADIKAIVVDSADYTFDAAHEFLSSIPVGARVATSANLAGKTVAAATAAFDSNDVIFPNVTGDQIEAIVLVIDTGDPATSPLLMFQDTNITNAPLTPNGTNITITVGAGGWFTL
jgi:hypothetical protein